MGELLGILRFASDIPVLIPHGLAVQIDDVPLPLSAFYLGAMAALVLSFALLAVGAHRLAPGRLVPRASEAHGGTTAAFHPVWRVVGGVLGVLWLVATIATAMFGGTDGAGNPAPNLVFVFGWIGFALACVVFGRAALAVHGPLALARFGGMEEHPAAGASRRDPLGLWVAWAGVAVFVWLELVYPTSSHVRLLGGIVLAWTIAVLVVSSRAGARRVRESLDPFSAYGRVLASLAPTWHDGTRRRWRVPLLGANHDTPLQPGLPAFVTLLIGSVSYDGLTRTDWWAERVSLATADLARSGVDPDTARIAFGTFGIVCIVLLAHAAFEGASWLSGRIGGFGGRGGQRAAMHFAPSLIPIAFGYVVAHYFSFFTVQVQDLVRLASDPFEQGWNLLGTADLKLRDLWIPSGTTVWIVQVASIVVAHVAGLLLAHDRALELTQEGDASGHADARRATLSQLPMLVLMLLYTVGGLYFLSEGLQ